MRRARTPRIKSAALVGLNRLVQEIAERHALASVARETDGGILTPRYTTSALEQMGATRAYGESRCYVAAFTPAFVRAWEARFTALGGV